MLTRAKLVVFVVVLAGTTAWSQTQFNMGAMAEANWNDAAGTSYLPDAGSLGANWVQVYCWDPSKMPGILQEAASLHLRVCLNVASVAAHPGLSITSIASGQYTGRGGTLPLFPDACASSGHRQFGLEYLGGKKAGPKYLRPKSEARTKS